MYREVVEFAKNIGMVPIELKKEKAGYVLNSLLVPLLNAASDLLIDGIADPDMVDKTWRIGTGAPFGPFQIMDVVGLTTVYNISSQGGEKQREFATTSRRTTSTRASSASLSARASTTTRADRLTGSPRGGYDVNSRGSHRADVCCQ